MSPWDELNYFDLPVETAPILTTNSIYQIEANPRRVLLLITTTSSQQCYLRRSSAVPTGSETVGIPIKSSQPICFRQQQDGSLAQIAWQLNNPNTLSQQFYVLELTMRDWPAVNGRVALAASRLPGPSPAAPPGLRPTPQFP